MLGLSHQYGKSMYRRRSPSVANWAVGFEKILEDPVGLKTFTEFLRREFSAENIMFWIVCEEYRNQSDKHQRKKLAKDIIDHYVRPGAPEPVNIDCHTRQKILKNMSELLQDLFVPAQKLIFNLMKFDCYQRFLKSDLFEESLTAERLGKPLPFQELFGSKSPKKCRSRSKSRDRYRLIHPTKLNLSTNLHHNNNSSNENKNNNNNENSPTAKDEISPKDELDEKKRKSLLPWPKGRAKSTEPERSSSRSPVLRERGSNVRRSKRKTTDKKNFPDREKSKTHSSSNTLEVTENSSKRLSLEEKSGPNLLPPQTIEKYNKFCRLIFPDSSTAIISQDQSGSAGDVIREMLDRRGVSGLPVEAIVKDSSLVVDLNLPLSSFSGKEIIMEPRAILRLQLPSNKVIAIRAKPEQTCLEILEPVLKKYGFEISKTKLVFDGSSVSLNMNEPIKNVDRCKICVQLMEPAKGVENSKAVPVLMKMTKKERKDVTSHMFEEIVKGQVYFYYDELGILDLENSNVTDGNPQSHAQRSSANIDAPRRNSFSVNKDEKPKSRSLYTNRASIHEGMGIKIQLNEVTTPQESNNTTPRRSISKNVHYRDSCDLTRLWNRAQRRYDDQRGSELNCEMPDFLRDRSDSSPSKLTDVN